MSQIENDDGGGDNNSCCAKTIAKCSKKIKATFDFFFAFKFNYLGVYFLRIDFD